MSTVLQGAPPPPLAPARGDATTIGLVGLAHGTSHFFHMLLPPLFPAFIAEFDVSYAQLGWLVTVFFVISGVGQATAGFVVDRVGARPVLFAALACFVAAALAAASAQSFAGLMLAAALAGLGNCPFHPADFTILNKRVSAPRLGHAFSVHGITGNLGWAVAPLFLVGISSATGSWRVAAACAALWALTVLLLLWWQREHLDDRTAAMAARAAPAPASAAAPVAAAEHPLAFLRLPSVWLCFSFFLFSTAALAAIQSFASPALAKMYGLPLAATAFVVSGYMVCGAAGMVVGGFLVPRAQRLEVVIGAAMFSGAAALALVATGWLPSGAALLVAAIAGFATGLAGPSRDMLIKRAAPPGATGRVYGTVYSGLDVGFALAAPLFGWLLDRAAPHSVFAGASLALLCGVVSAWAVAWAVRARQGRMAA
jgi:MFS transporter, FSR family, fosmidomycin resistance protein